ncbi:transglycosylase SLT domain-containing protein [Methylomonas sp. AM2-LC]|uniref:transglycosylase SLT domain-containing protein n=1 Tax=Methylomonas sp. AM2-LC TaxID=3153301 RepID=UPI003264B20B
MSVASYQRSTELGALPEARQEINASPERLLNPNAAVVAGGLSQMGEEANKVYSDIYSAQQQQFFRDKALDGRNQSQQFLNKLLYDPNNGVLSRQGASAFQADANGVSPLDSALNTFKDHAQSVADSLGNDESKRQYLEWANEQTAHTSGLILQHMGQQARVYQRGVYQATIDTNKQTMAANNNNVTLLEQQVGGIYQAAGDLAKLEGLPPEAGIAAGTQHASDALKGAFGVALEQKNPAAANEILRNFGKHMTPDDWLAASHALNNYSTQSAALQAANQAMVAAAPYLQTGDQARINNITVGSESSGQHWDDTGAPTKSAAGAIGIGQIMPDTAPEAAKAAGLPWLPELFNAHRSGDAAKDDAAVKYNRALSSAYLSTQMQKYGDLRLGWAAYNAGPGKVDAAIDQAREQGGSPLQYLPKETQDYVQKNMTAYSTGGGQFARPTEEQVVNDATNLFLKSQGGNADPQALRLVREQASSNFRLHDQAIKQQESDGLSAAQRWIEQNPGQLAQMPPSIRSAVPAGHYDAMIQYDHRVANGSEPPDNWPLWSELMNNRTKLQQTDLLSLRYQLSNNQFEQLTERKTTQKQPEAMTRLQSNDAIFNDYAHQAGLETGARFDNKGVLQNKEVVDKVATLQSKFITAVRHQEDIQKKPLTEDQVRKVAAGVFTPVKVVTPGRIYGTNETDTIAGLLKGTENLAVPAEDRAAIVDKFAQKVGRAPNEVEINALYRKHLGL